MSFWTVRPFSGDQRRWLPLLLLALAPLLALWFFDSSSGEQVLVLESAVPVPVPAAEPAAAAAGPSVEIRSSGRSEVAVVTEGSSPRTPQSPAQVRSSGAADVSAAVADPGWCTIVGRLELADGGDIHRSHAELWKDDGERTWVPLRSTTLDGAFEAYVERPGQYQLQLVTYAVGVTSAVEVQLVLGEAVDVGVLRLETGLRMEGRVTFQSGEPLAGGVLYFEVVGEGAVGAGSGDGTRANSTFGARQLAITTDSDGVYSFSGLLPGTFKVSVRSSPLQVIEGELIAAGTVGHRIVVEGSVLVVRLMGEDGPVRGIKRVVATPTTPIGGKHTSSVHEDPLAQQALRHSTRLVDIRAGIAYRVLGEDHLGRMYGADWPADQPGGRHRLDLMPYTVDAGEILLRALGEGVAGDMQVIVTSLTREGVNARALKVERETGKGLLLHRLKGLPAGAYELSCYLETGGLMCLDEETYCLDVEPGAVTTVEMDVVAGGRLRIELRPPPGSEESRPALVQIRRRAAAAAAGGESAWAPLVFWMAKGAAAKKRGATPRMRRERIQINGEVAITPGHSPGEYELRITHPAFEERRVNCRVIAGETTTCECEFE